MILLFRNFAAVAYARSVLEGKKKKGEEESRMPLLRAARFIVARYVKRRITAKPARLFNRRASGTAIE